MSPRSHKGMLARGIAFAALMAVAAPAFAQASGDVVMRRPLPNSKSTSTQDGCEATGTCTPTPTTGPSSPTPTDDPTSTQTDCPAGHICSPPVTPTPSTTPPETGNGWYLHCNMPTLADCESTTRTGVDSDGNPMYDYVTLDPSSCDAPQSDAQNAIVQGVGDLPPGQFYDFTEMCGLSKPSVPSPTPGCNYNGNLVSDQPEPNFWDTYNAVYQWSTTGWSDGAQCGQTSNMTRTATCLMITQNNGGGIGIGPIGKADPIGKPEVMQASYTPGDVGSIRPGVYDPSSNEARLVKAQFGGDSGASVTVTSVPAAYCANIDPVCNQYSGPDANCGYQATPDSIGSGGGAGGGTGGGTGGGSGGSGGTSGSDGWTLPDGAPGTATCSAYAQRPIHNTCVNGSGATVSDRFCIDNLINGGSYDAEYDTSMQYGNLSGCTAQWVGEPSDLGCSPDGDSANDGPTHYASYHYQCERSDGTVLTGVDEAACTGEKPFDGVKAVGVCNKHYGLSQQYACYTTIDGQFDADVMNTPNFSGYPSSDVIDKFCSDNGADCCAVGDGGNDNFYGYRIYAARNAQPAYEPNYNIGIYAAGTASGWVPDAPAPREPSDAPPLNTGNTGSEGGGGSIG